MPDLGGPPLSSPTAMSIDSTRLTVAAPDAGETTAAAANATDRLIAAAVFAATILLLLPLWRFFSFDADEGLTIYGAERLLTGQVPYRDFFTLVTPGSYYLVAAEFRLFGHSLVNAHTALLFYGAAIAALTYLLARRLYGRGPSLVASYLVALCIPPVFIVGHNWDSTFSPCWQCILRIPCWTRALASGLWRSASPSRPPQCFNSRKAPGLSWASALQPSC